MEALISSLFETEWGLIILGTILIITLLIEFFSNNKPKI